jgi:hypothetical protein
MELHEPYVEITKWGFKWIRFAYNYVLEGGPADKFANDIIKTFDDVAEDPLDYVETHVYTNEHRVVDKQKCVIKASEVKKQKKVLAKGKRSAFAASVAKIAYNKFGERKMSDANILVTRKWIAKYLEEPEFKDLRVCDKNLAIDRALFLSFIPTNDFRAMKLALGTSAWSNRVDANGVFGKIFRLVSPGKGPGDLPE